MRTKCGYPLLSFNEADFVKYRRNIMKYFTFEIPFKVSLIKGKR